MLINSILFNKNYKQMKKISFLKPLLLAVGLLTGASAWADKETVTLLNIDYSTVTTPAWTVVGGDGAISDGAWTHSQGGGSGARSAYLDLGLNNSIEDNWSLSFDVTVSTGSTWTQASDFQIAVSADGASYTNNAKLYSKILFGVYLATTKSNMGSALACTITLNDVEDAQTVTISHNTQYTFNVAVDGTTLKASIMNGSTEVYSGSTTLSSFVKPRGIYDLLPRPYNASWGVYSSKYDNIKVTKEVEAGFVDTPSASITAVNGISRTVSFTCPTEGVSFSYSTDNGSTWTDGNSVVISQNTDIIVKATKGSTSAQSEVLSFQAGTAIELNAPAWTKTGYANGVSTVTLADNQNNILLTPTTTIKYQINDGDAQTYSAAISVNNGETLKYWSEATGYSNSSVGSVTAMAPCTYPIIFTETYNGNDAGITVNTEEVVATIGGNNTPYYYMNANDTHVSEYLITSNTGASNWLLRTTGIYAGNTANYAVRNVKKGDYVTITIVWGTERPVPSSNDGELDLWNSTAGASYVFKVTSTMGNFRFSLGRYASVKTITIQRAAAPVTISSAGWATLYSENALNFSGIDGLTAYTATLSENTVTLTEVSDVPANSGVVLKGTAGTYSIPFIASSETDKGDLEGNATGATAYNAFEGYDLYMLALNTHNEAQFTKVSSGSIAAGKAFLKVPATNTARSFKVVFAGETTGISEVYTKDDVRGGTFNLSGQRVAQPTKGLYVVNGKKVIMK
jgi:hypothetical protein